MKASKRFTLTPQQAYELAQGYGVAESEGLATEVPGLREIVQAMETFGEKNGGVPLPPKPRIDHRGIETVSIPGVTDDT